MNYFVQFTILCMYFDMFLLMTFVFMLSLYVLYARWYVLNMWYMNIHVYIFKDLSWFFHNFLSFLCSVLRVPSEFDPSRWDRPISCQPRPRLWTMSRHKRVVEMPLMGTCTNGPNGTNGPSKKGKEVASKYMWMSTRQR